MTKIKALPDMRGTDQPEHADYLARGGEPYGQVICPQELYPLVLVAKLHEEAEEIREALDDVNEYADVLNILYSLAALNGITPDQIERAYWKRLHTKGGFTLGKVLVK